MGFHKGSAKGKKKADPTADTQADAQANSQEDNLTVVQSVEQPDTRRLTTPSPKPRKFRSPPKRLDGRPSKAFQYGSAIELFRKPEFPETPQPSSPAQETPKLQYAWPPLSPGKVYDKISRMPWSLPWTPPPAWMNWPRKFIHPTCPSPEESQSSDESELTSTEETPSRKRNRAYEDDSPSVKRHRLLRHTPSGMAHRPRGSPRTTYADRARRREAERNGRIERTIYRVPQLLAQQGQDARCGQSTPASRALEQTTIHDNNIVPFSALPSAFPQNETQPGWRRWIFDSVTRLWRRGNAPQTGETATGLNSFSTHAILVANNMYSVAENQTGNENEASVPTPSTAPPSSSAVFFTPESPSPRSRIGEPQTANSRSSANTQVAKRKRYSYDLDPRGFDPELLARMRARSSKPGQTPANKSVPAPSEQVPVPEDIENKKRKRQPSPDVIPHPPGCSYGFDPDYFIYDDDEEEESATEEQTHQKTMPKQATVSDAPEEEHEHVSKRARSDKTRPANFNHQGHFQTPGWSSSSPEGSPQNDLPVQFELPHFIPDPTPGPITGAEAIRFARRVAEQYKPKTPSRLRNAHRFSSSSNFERDLVSEPVDVIRRRRIGPHPRTLAKACPTGDLHQIIWPEPEPWISRLALSPDLERYMDLVEIKHYQLKLNDNFHLVFKKKLAERREQRKQHKRERREFEARAHATAQ